LAYLANLENLTGLHLGETRVGSRGLEHLGKMEKIEKLWLHDTSVDDKAAEAFSQFRKMRELYVYNTRISMEGMALIRKALPNCKVISD